MRTPLLAGIALSVAMALPAFAQSSSSSTQPAPTATNGPTHNTAGGGMAIRDQVKHDLEQAGFTNVRIMPESFLVRANDKEGHPVMMLINPDSVMAVTNLGATSSGANGPNSQSTINSGASAGSSALSSGSSPSNNSLMGGSRHSGTTSQ